MNLKKQFLCAALVCCTTATWAFPPEPKYDVLVPLTPENVAIGHLSWAKDPVVKVKSGAVVKINGGGGVRWNDNTDPSTWLKENGVSATLEDTPALAETVKVLKETKRAEGIPGGHMLVGPVYVEGAEPGDTLEVRILDVRPRIPFGTVSTMPGKGGIPDLVPRPFTRVVRYDAKRDVGIFEDGVEIPLKPFMGVMGVAQPLEEVPIRKSGPPGVFGGNLDLKELVTGSTLYLPVFHKGGLFYTGDSHGGQGDGEVTVSAIESANSCTLQFIVHKGKTIASPRAENATHFMAIGLDPDLNKAMRMAITETIKWLGELKGYDFFNAYTLSSIGVDFHVTQVVDGTQGIHSMIPKSIFTKDKFEY